ncbi:Uma2 family endonuclease [Streptomyces sulphureus]|uniref:Uma2 family endonuclease n=1 Tax=Streptomyces sulphureus TaxID=47758 RepID=UPI0003689F43|nr:Uma2 family endonuclease [Streptomyces sulphureus]
MTSPAYHSIPVRPGRLREAAEQIEEATGMRVEIVGGSLSMSPSRTGEHVGIVIDLRDAVRPHLPGEYEAFENISLPMAGNDDDYATPDLTVGPRAFKDMDDWLLESEEVQLAVEVVSPSERLKGINEKTAWYAAAGVRILLRVDPRTGTWSLFGRPDRPGSEYRGVEHGKYGESVPLPAELGGELETSGLARYTR